MSQTTKKKYVEKEVLGDFRLPTGEERIVKVLAGRGNNLHLVLDPAVEGCGKYLVSMPAKFRKTIWIKRGDFTIVQPIPEGDKVRAEIVAILYKQQIRHIKLAGRWPKFPGEEEFQDPQKSEGAVVDLLFENPNRPKARVYSDSSEEEDTEETGGDPKEVEEGESAEEDKGDTDEDEDSHEEGEEEHDSK